MPGWSGWAALDGGYTGGVSAVGPNADGRLEVFGLESAPGGSQIATNWQTAPNGGWSGWASLGSPPQNDVLSHVTAASNADGRLEAFVRYGAMSAGVMWHAWQTAPNGSWSGWSNLGVSVGHVTSGAIVVASNADGRLELFAIGGDLPGVGITHAWQTAPNGGWSAQANLGTPSGILLSGVAVGANTDGRLAVFSHGSDGTIWQIAQTAPNAGWGSWSSLGAASETLNGAVVGSNADGRLEVFSTGAQGVWHAWQTAPNGSSWSGWSNLGWPSGATNSNGLAVGRNADGRLELFDSLIGSGEVWHIWQTAPNGGWSTWDTLGGEPADAVQVGRNQDGRLEIFVVGRGAGGVWHRWQLTPGGAWST